MLTIHNAVGLYFNIIHFLLRILIKYPLACSNIVDKQKISIDPNCNIPCSDNPSFFCGGSSNFTNSYSLSTITTGNAITIKGCQYAVPAISCGPNQQILNNGIIKYGRWDNNVCPPVNPQNPFNYTLYSLPTRCVGQNSCILGTTNGLVDLPDPYKKTIKHFEITYNCGLFPLITTDNSMYIENNGCESDFANLLCPVNQYISEGYIMYGRWDNIMCPGPGVSSLTPISYNIFNLPFDCLQGINNCRLGSLIGYPYIPFSQKFGDPSPGVYKHV